MLHEREAFTSGLRFHYCVRFMVAQPGRGLRIRVTLDGDHVVSASMLCQVLLPNSRFNYLQIGSPVEDLMGLVQPEWYVSFRTAIIKTAFTFSFFK